MWEYDLIADWYPSDRGISVGVKEALTAVAPLPSASRVLDVGCGNGFPITDALVKAVLPSLIVARIRINVLLQYVTSEFGPIGSVASKMESKCFCEIELRRTDQQ